MNDDETKKNKITFNKDKVGEEQKKSLLVDISPIASSPVPYSSTSSTAPLHSLSAPTSPMDNNSFHRSTASPTLHAMQQSVSAITSLDSEMQEIVDDVRQAIDMGIHPMLIAKGSSGSYFCRNTRGEIVGVFKPKNEEPYGKLNPKWTKWLHKTCCPCCFGRSCLMPNTGYVSEAAAYIVDKMLGLGVVPKTFVIHLASPSFYYSYLDRKTAERTGIYPPKIGSFQLYMNGYIDASKFMREGPNMLRDGRLPVDQATGQLQESLQNMFQHQFERLAILDYIIRNTDRGLDNWMVKYVEAVGKEVSNDPQAEDDGFLDIAVVTHAKILIAAIDNGLAFPFKHPDEWRSYPYGWALLPAAHVAFSQETRQKLLPFLSSRDWWLQLTAALRHVMEKDDEFDEKIFRRQIAVMKGQVYNLVQVLSSFSSSAPAKNQTDTESDDHSLSPTREQLLPERGSPVDMVSMPPCLVWEDDDVRYLAGGLFGRELRDGVLGTVIGGIGALKNR